MFQTTNQLLYLLSATDMAEVEGPLSVVKVCTSMRVSVSGWSPMFSKKIEHPMSTCRYFSFPLILSVVHICEYLDMYT